MPDLKDAILAFAATYQLDSAQVIDACADVLAITAVQLDARGGLSKCRIEERLHTFDGRVLQLYRARASQRQTFETVHAVSRRG